MYTNITDIAITLKLDPKIVAQIYKEGFMRGLQAREQDESIKEIRTEIDSNIY